MQFIVQGPPIGKGRQRSSVRSKPATDTSSNPYYIHMYTPNKTADYEKQVRMSFLEQIKCFEPTDKYIKMTLTAVFGIPKRTSKKKREQMLNGELLPDKKPDVDNIAKIILDGLNQVLYYDDKQVVELTTKKIYGETPCVIVDYELK